MNMPRSFVNGNTQGLFEEFEENGLEDIPLNKELVKTEITI